MYVPKSVLDQLDRLQQMNKTNRKPWDLFAKNAEIGFELDTNFGWLFKKRKP